MQERMALAAALLGVALVPANAFASAPAGVWVKVQQVVYAPDAASPSRVQVHGALMLYDGNTGPDRPYAGYTAPALGYMYYECPQGQAETCQQEWQDLEANITAEDTVCVGFGMNSLPTGTLRQPSSVPSAPDAYPIQSGVSPGYSPCQAIAQFLSSEQGGAGGAGGASSTGGAGASTGGAGASTGRAGASTGGAGASTGGKPASAGGKPGSMADGGANSGGNPASNSAGSGKAGATTGRAGSGTGNLDPSTEDDKTSGCSIAAATGAASLLGLGAAAGLVGLALARRHRSRR